jgi:hypothetical protein
VNARERLHAVLNFKKPDMLPLLEWAAWWDKTVERWHGEGLDKELDGIELLKYFDLDVHYREWFNPRGSFGELKEGKERWAGVVSSLDEYEEKVTGLVADGPCIDKSRLNMIAEQYEKGDAIYWLQVDGFFWFPREILGVEPHMMTLYDSPEFIHRINKDILDYNIRTLGQICEVLTPDLITISEDMSYNHGPMLSEEMFDEFLAPYYEQYVPELKKRNIHVFVDSDGDITPLIPWLMRVGVEGIVPLERMAGVDVNAIRNEYPDWKMIGAYDKTVMHKGEEALKDEFERLMPVMKGGGFIPSVDHQTPPGVSFDQYKQYLSLLKEYAVKACE